MKIKITNILATLILSLIFQPVLVIAQEKTQLDKDSVKKPDNAINISKTKIEMKKNQKSDFFTVFNKSKTEEFGFTVEIVKWSQKDSKNVYEKTDNIIAAPKTFVIQPGQYKNIRLVTKDYPEAVKDYSYRLILTQISRVKLIEETEKANKLKINLTLTLPIFFYSSPFREHDLLKIETEINDKDKTISIKNNDTQDFFLNSVNIDGKNYENKWYVLPNSEVKLNIKDLQNIKTHTIELVTNRTTIKK